MQKNVFRTLRSEPRPFAWLHPAVAGKERDFTLGFVGKDWKRKGLPLLIALRDELARRSWKVRVLAAGDIRLTKSLGQNFLHDANQLRRIVTAAELALRPV